MLARPRDRARAILDDRDFYAAMMVLQLVWVLRVMPETKGVALEDIQKRLGIA